MPFPKSTLTKFPGRSADVQIVFNGLMLLFPDPGDPGICRIGIHNDSHGYHQFSLNVYERGTGREIKPTGALTPPLTIGISPFSGAGTVEKFTPAGKCSPVPASLQDFCWSVDFKALHPGAKVSSTLGAAPGITLRNGLLFTAGISDPAELTVTLKPPVGRKKDWQRIAEDLGANVYLGLSEQLEIRNAAGKVLITLPDDGNIGAGYRIIVDNLPRTGTPPHDDFPEYYNAITPVSVGAQYGLELKKSPRNIDTPCMASVLDGDGRT